MPSIPPIPHDHPHRHRRPIASLATVSLAVLALATASHADSSSTAVQWRTEDGGNGHWYVHTVIPYPMGTNLCGIDWAVEHADGLGAYPATVTSAEEEAFVLEVMPYFNSTYSTAFLGGRRDSSSSAWYWVTGEPFEYANFIGGVSVGQSIHLYDEESFFGPGWRRGYDCFVVEDVTVDEGVSVILEWSADCNDDGIVDYGQILDGTFADLDQNGVPDCCDAGKTCDPVDAGPIQWRTEDGGNGHWYAVEIITETFCPREDYLPTARLRGADPISIQSSEENELVLELIPAFHPTYATAVLGCVRDAGAGWRWLNGDEWTFEDWIHGQGQTQSEPTATIYDESSPYGPGWHDYPGECHTASSSVPTALIFEWSADCNDDGIVDYGQILDGTVADLDQNGVPDCCDAGEPCDDAPTTTIESPKLVLGTGFAAAITEDGRVIAWGDNTHGVLDIPDGIVDPVEIAAWEYHVVVLQADGTVVSWGNNTYGQTNVPKNLPTTVSVAALGRGSLAIHADGSVSGWGDDYWCGAGTSTLDLPQGLDIREISGGNAHWLYRLGNGFVAGNGCNYNGQWNVPGSAQPPLDFEANESWSCVLSPAGTIHVFGWGGYGIPNAPTGSGYLDIACGHYFGLALSPEGAIRHWGSNQQGQGNIPAGLESVRSLNAGATYAAAIHDDGTLTMWGDNSRGQCDWPTDERIRLVDVDCDADGVADWREILEGTGVDADGDGRLDECDGPAEPPCPADLSGDGLVGPIDLGLLLTFWGTDGQNNPQADIDGDGQVGPLDLGLVLSGWGICPEG